MPGTPTPWRANRGGVATMQNTQRRQAAGENQQYQVITDPTHATGDPAHGWATTVIGQLAPITGLAGFGIAIWAGTAWERISGGASGTGSLSFAASSTASVTINHGLGATPTKIFLTATNVGGSTIAMEYDTAGSTSFRALGFTYMGGFSATPAITATWPFSWRAEI